MVKTLVRVDRRERLVSYSFNFFNSDFRIPVGFVVMMSYDHVLYLLIIFYILSKLVPLVNASTALLAQQEQHPDVVEKWMKNGFMIACT